MTDKKTFGSFIKAKRTEKNYSQKDLADKLFVTEGAVSKWERGVSYPDITLISHICTALDISEHELITASADPESDRIKKEAKSFRIIRSAWFLVPTISYITALIPCFICNLAIDKTLSWFFIVLTALMCAYTFIPTVSMFFKTNKLLIFTGSSYLSICLLLFTCAVYTNTLFWFPTAAIGTLIGYTVVFLPMLLSKTKIGKLKFVISFVLTLVLTLLMLCYINTQTPFMLTSAILITLYGYMPVIVCTVICTLRLDAFLKSGICVFLSSVVFYFTGHIATLLFGPGSNNYEVDFYNWPHHVNGNTLFIILFTCIIVSVVFITIGVIRIKKNT